MNDALLAAVHAQPVVVVIVPEPVPPLAAIDWVVGDTLNEQDPAA